MSIWFIAFILILEAALIAASLLYLGTQQSTANIPEHLYPVLLSILLGGLGGCTYCLRGVYLNACFFKRWDTVWLPWYIIRPFVSFIAGGVSFLFVKSGLLLFGGSSDNEVGLLSILAVAFISGLNVDKFIAKIESVGQTVLGLDLSRQSKPE